mgnify:CR=1 FL=1
MKSKLRLVLVEPNGSGGLIHYTYQLCTALAGEGADVTLITGPSRTADIERVLTIGVHGPSRFAIIAVDEAPKGGASR